MTPSQGPNPDKRDPEAEEFEAAWNEARQRFIAGFPKRSDSIGYLLGLVATLGPQGPLVPLRQIVHRTAGLAGTVGFPAVSARARELEDLLEQCSADTLDVSRANSIYESIEEAFGTDLADAPSWSRPGPKTDRRQRIMLVEDDEDQREVMGIHLHAAGFETIMVPTGDAAVDAARQHRPDLILLDANLPGLDGYSVCRLLKLDPDLTDTPVIFVTRRGGLDDKLVGLLLGADEYLIKPVDPTELVLRIQLLLARKAKAPAAQPVFSMPDQGKELDFETFVALAREQLALQPATFVLIRTPEARQKDAYALLRSESRRRDMVACYGPAHIVQLLAGMPVQKAADRLTDMIHRLRPGVPPRFQVGLAVSEAGGAKTFEALLGEADEATITAHRLGILLIVAGEPLPDTPVPRNKGTVVLADDDPDVLRLVDAQLKAAGYATHATADGSQAVAAVEQFHPDILIVDMMMPRMSGFDVLASIRDNPARPRTIVLSARGREQDVTRAFALGADDYMTKPFSPQELLARIERLLR